MAFFDNAGNQLTIQEFINANEPFYFLGSQNIGRKVTRKNKTARFIENNIENVLSNGITINDLIL